MALNSLKILIPVLYFALRYGLSSKWQDLNQYGPEIFDGFFCLIVFWAYRSKLSFVFEPKARWAWHSAAALIAGYGVHKLAIKIGLPIPFGLDDFLALGMLLILGPVLEESLFRQALWLPLEDSIKKRWLVILLSASFFSVSHLASYPGVPDPIKTFVIFQALYTFIIGLWWGHVRSKSHSVLLTGILHSLFNLGFFLSMVF